MVTANQVIRNMYNRLFKLIIVFNERKGATFIFFKQDFTNEFQEKQSLFLMLL